MDSYIVDIIIKSGEDNCLKLNNLIETGIIYSSEIIKIILLSEEIEEKDIKFILKNILFLDIEEFQKILNYLNEIDEIDKLMMIKEYLVPRLKEFIKNRKIIYEGETFSFSSDATYRDWIGIIFPIHIDTCIRNLSKKQKEEELIMLLESNDKALIKDFLNNNLDNPEGRKIIKKYSINLRKKI